MASQMRSTGSDAESWCTATSIESKERWTRAASSPSLYLSKWLYRSTDADAGLVGEATHRQLFDSVLVDEIPGGVEHVRAGSL